MDSGVAWVGMRVAYNAIAKKRKGIIVGWPADLRGVVTNIDEKNHLGGQVLRVRWDDGETRHVSPYWLKRVEWTKGGYTHGKRRDLQNADNT